MWGLGVVFPCRGEIWHGVVVVAFLSIEGGLGGQGAGFDSEVGLEVAVAKTEAVVLELDEVAAVEAGTSSDVVVDVGGENVVDILEDSPHEDPFDQGGPVGVLLDSEENVCVEFVDVLMAGACRVDRRLRVNYMHLVCFSTTSDISVTFSRRISRATSK